MLQQSWARFKIFTQRDVRALRRSISPLSQPRVSYIDRCADELVDAFIAVPVTSLFRGGVLPSHDLARISSSCLEYRASTAPDSPAIYMQYSKKSLAIREWKDEVTNPEVSMN